MTEDGISLTSMAHPKGSLWNRIKLFFKWPKLNPDSLMVVEIYVKEKQICQGSKDSEIQDAGCRGQKEEAE